MDAHDALLPHLILSRHLDTPVVGFLIGHRNGKGKFLVINRHTLGQGIQGLLGRHGRLGLGGLDRHQSAHSHGGAQYRRHQHHAGLFLEKQIHQSSFHLPAPAAQPGGVQGETGAVGGVTQEDLTVVVPKSGIPACHHRVVAAVFQIPTRLPAHPPHQRVEPVGGVDQQQ